MLHKLQEETSSSFCQSASPICLKIMFESLLAPFLPVEVIKDNTTQHEVCQCETKLEKQMNNTLPTQLTEGLGSAEFS